MCVLACLFACLLTCLRARMHARTSPIFIGGPMRQHVQHAAATIGGPMKQHVQHAAATDLHRRADDEATNSATTSNSFSHGLLAAAR